MWFIFFLVNVHLRKIKHHLLLLIHFKSILNSKGFMNAFKNNRYMREVIFRQNFNGVYESTHIV